MEIVIVIGALLVVFLIASWLFKLVSTTLRTVLFVVFVLLSLWIVFGIGPDTVWEQIQQWRSGNR